MSYYVVVLLQRSQYDLEEEMHNAQKRRDGSSTSGAYTVTQREGTGEQDGVHVGTHQHRGGLNQTDQTDGQIHGT